MNERVTIVIVSYNCHDALWECLRKLNGGAGVPPIIVVDNSSTDESVELVTKDFPAVRLIRNPTNCGFAAAANQGIRASTSDFILLLAPDMFLNMPDLQKLYEAIYLRPKVGICAPRILNPSISARPVHLSLPTITAIICKELGLIRPFPSHRCFARYRMGGWIEADRVDQASRSCLLLRRTALEHIGLLDEQFFLYFEDVDLCWRLRQGGWQTLFVTDAIVTQNWGSDDKTERAETLGRWYQGLFAFYRRHRPRWQLPVLRGVVQVAALFRIITGKREYWPIAKSVWKL